MVDIKYFPDNLIKIATIFHSSVTDVHDAEPAQEFTKEMTTYKHVFYQDSKEQHHMNNCHVCLFFDVLPQSAFIYINVES